MYKIKDIYKQSNIVVPLVLISFMILILVLVFVFFNYNRLINNLDEALASQLHESQKMKINSELIELARYRTRITSEILNSEDEFIIDELNISLERHAGRFSKLKKELVQLPLNSEEKDLIHQANTIIQTILPAQRNSVEMAIIGENIAESKKIFYHDVLPGQDTLIDLLSKMITLEQKQIAFLTESNNTFLKNINSQNKLVSLSLITISIILALTVVSRVRTIQLKLKIYSKTLEKINADQENIINERTKELKSLNTLLKETSERDELTGLYNRRKFNLFLSEECERSDRFNTPFTLILIDIDHLKDYNDNYGHTKGDQCLETVAQTMRHSLPRSVDFIARYGGEEFAILLPGTDIKGAIKVADIVRDAVIAAQIPHKASSVNQYVTISLGVAAYQPNSHTTSISLINSADEMLYLAKENGRNRVEPQNL